MREIILDTETTGLSPLKGDRVVEIGCVEAVNHVTTGQTYHVYLNPERDMPEAAAKVHGLTAEFLADKPVFAEVVDEFLTFIGDSKLVIHNASFDMGFINAELTRVGFPTLPMARSIDTLEIARKKFFGAPATLDALCKRFGIDTSVRTLHGALLDAQLLAEVYLELCGGRQTNLDIAPGQRRTSTSKTETIKVHQDRIYLTPRPHKASNEELTAHAVFIKKLKDPIWDRIEKEED